MFVADFIGSPPMNFIHFEGMIGIGRLDCGHDRRRRDRLPELRESRASGPLALGVRPEQVVIGDPGRQGGAIPGEVFGAEYLGTTQIVTLTTPRGTLKARISPMFGRWPATGSASRSGRSGSRCSMRRRARRSAPPLHDAVTTRRAHG
jgi:multiple sugar transport system ATP-binding protein